MFEISTLEFLVQKEETSNLGPKSLIWIFLGRNFEKLLPYLKSEPSNLSKCKICAKQKNFKFGTKNALLGYF